MRKSGQKQIQKKPGGAAASQSSGSSQGFQGFKISSTLTAPRKPSALAEFKAEIDNETQLDDQGRKVGISMSLTGTHGETIHSEQEIKDSQKLVIPVKRNAEKWKPSMEKTEESEDNLKKETPPPLTLREQAIRSLIGGDDHLGAADQTAVVIGTGDQETAEDVDEDTYERVPVEMFGAAMLRGMGWKDAANGDKNDKHDASKPRPSLLGLGARVRPAEEDEQEEQKSRGIDIGIGSSRRKIKRF
ncbi:hypothetical protein J3B02_000380 [Coemansia erecta]|nr:hypothetical protein J3B02_000380 [Coemansia erecta]